MLSAIRFLILALCCFSHLTLTKGQSVRTLYTSHANDNWFMSAGIGNSVYMGEDIYHNQLVFKDVIIPNINVNGGKWLTPSVGVRMVAGFCSLGGENPRSYLKVKQDPVKERINILEGHLNLMVDVFNLFDSYNRHRKITVITYAGPGATRTVNSLNFPQNFHLNLKAGGVVKYNLSEALSVFTDIQGTVIPVSYQANKDFDYDGLVTVSAGISYVFKGKKRGFIPVQYYLTEAVTITDEE